MTRESSLNALHTTSLNTLFAYHDKLGIAHIVNALKFLRIGFTPKQFLFKSDFGLPILNGKSKKFCIPQSFVVPIYNGNTLTSLLFEAYPVEFYNGRPVKHFILGEKENFFLESLGATSILIVDSIIDCALLFKATSGVTNIICTCGQKLSQESLKKINNASSVLYFVSQFDENRLQEFYDLQREFEFIMPAPIVGAETLYETDIAARQGTSGAETIDEHVNYAFDELLYKSSYLRTGIKIARRGSLSEYLPFDGKGSHTEFLLANY